ncbi:SIMPL domain-containing protein [Sphingomonas sp. HHU CXW]|uniref:SIMPL domain-containing protein n=1 Tax=Sphingomonas hominis TaxID=2741495 RepID=A0ABX2JIE0_9SPHN|nr:SIMPL domain-containing protein [Sphingomonas hominis]NTS66172.1 SIMPL domain-containing protein [Sphingomonas hominis]
MRTGLVLVSMGVMAATAMPVVAQTNVPVQAVPVDGTVLEVSATGRVVRAPDVATIRAGVVTQSATAAAALGDNAARMAQVIASLKATGIATRDLSTSNVSLQPQYRYGDNQPPVITGYQASNSVSVKFRDIARSGAILDALVKAGANQIDGPAMSLSQPDAALDAARADAVKRAQARAALYAQAAGMRVERILSINEAGENDGGNPQPPIMARMGVSMQRADVSTTILPGETDVTATLNVRFILK